MRLADCLGQERITSTLRRLMIRNQVATTYLFSGPSGVGKTTAAAGFIAACFCLDRSTDGDACGVCISCRKLISGNHPDLHLLEPLPDKRDISIDQVRELQQSLAMRPVESARNACIIKPADRLNEKSANALLKTLEEPPGDALIILVATQADRLLPTIRSRTQQFSFSPLPDDVLLSIAHQKGVLGVSDDLVALAQGSVTNLLALAGEEERGIRHELLKVLAAADGHDSRTIVSSVEQTVAATNRDEALAQAERILSVIQDLYRLSMTGHLFVQNRFLLDQLIAEAARFNSYGLGLAVECAEETHRSVRANGNIRLCFERLLIEYDRLRKGVDR